MHKFFISPDSLNAVEGTITGDDVKHIYKVLRLDEGERVIINNCSGEEYIGEISSVTKTEVKVSILEKLEKNNESNIQVYLFQGLPKAQKMDLIVQKGTELGITSFIPIITERVDVKLKGEFKKIDRLSRIALEAAKQSKRSIIPTVSQPISFEDAINNIKDMDLFIVPYENAEGFGVKSLMKKLEEKNIVNNIKKIGIMIGPEGGFETKEIEKLKGEGAYIVTLGSRILRTETAGFIATSLIQYELGDLGGKA